MKVNLAAQTLSRSVARALEFVSHDLKLPKFADVSATVEFIGIIDGLFDTLNSKNPFATEFKAVMCKNNEPFWRPFLNEVVGYLRLNGQPLYQPVRKTAVLGFQAWIQGGGARGARPPYFCTTKEFF